MIGPLPYSIAVPDEKIDKLKQKLALATFPDELNGAEWDLGAPLADVKRLAEYWRTGYDWRAEEAKLNQLPQFHTKIEVLGKQLDIHFVHSRSPVEGAIPLLFCHGWPGSYLEVVKLLPLLKGGPNTPAFHVVAPSLPNFGWSSGVKDRGFALEQYAQTCHMLMMQLGYDQYVTQGGDWGYYVTRAMGLIYPTHVKASHINMLRGTTPKWSKNPFLALQHKLFPYTHDEKAGLVRADWFLTEGSGYRMLQSTKPQTLGYSLADSPVGLLAWIYEKLHDWTDSYPWTDDEILTWVSLYYFSTAGPAASVRIYYEIAHVGLNRDRAGQWIPHVKLGLAHFPKELTPVPSTWARTLGPVAHESVHKRGGHFAAHERPDAIAEDLRVMFKRGGPCYGIVEGCSGYAARAKL